MKKSLFLGLIIGFILGLCTPIKAYYGSGDLEDIVKKIAEEVFNDNKHIIEEIAEEVFDNKIDYEVRSIINTCIVEDEMISC